MAENVEPGMLFQDLQIIAAPPLDRKQLIEQIKDIFDVGWL